jgi:hypothetical protein
LPDISADNMPTAAKAAERIPRKFLRVIFLDCGRVFFGRLVYHTTRLSESNPVPSKRFKADLMTWRWLGDPEVERVFHRTSGCREIQKRI